jgi:hypothetical protein
MSASIDPVAPNSFWFFTEYAASPANTWSTWVLETRLVPFDDPSVLASTDAHDFGLHEVGTEPETLDVSIYNVGTPDLMISGITNSHAAYTLIGLPSFPVTVSTFDSVFFSVVFNPPGHGDAVDSIVVASNDPLNPNAPVYLDGRGIVIDPAAGGVMYAASGPTDGNLYSVNTSNGQATLIGPLGVDEIQGLAIHPTTHELWGIVLGVTESTLFRLAPAYGDALPKALVPVGNMRAIAFDESGTLYGATTGGGFYELDTETGDATLRGTAPGVNYSGLSQSPTSNLFYASVRGVIGRDRIFIVDPSNGDTTLVGSTGDNTVTPSLAFTSEGILYGLKGISTQENSLILVDTLDGTGTLVGLCGVAGMTSLAIRTDVATSVSSGNETSVPEIYSLSQNYPNPFNPSTEIVFGLPQQSQVRLTVYNVLGQEVRVLADGILSAGSHVATWDGLNGAGNAMASGIYFYRIEARSNESAPFIEVRKMLLLR